MTNTIHDYIYAHAPYDHFRHNIHQVNVQLHANEEVELNNKGVNGGRGGLQSPPPPLF